MVIKIVGLNIFCLPIFCTCRKYNKLLFIVKFNSVNLNSVSKLSVVRSQFLT